MKQLKLGIGECNQRIQKMVLKSFEFYALLQIICNLQVSQIGTLQRSLSPLCCRLGSTVWCRFSMD